MKKYITTTLPYINSIPHIGHTFEFCLADVIVEYYRHKLGASNVMFNVGVDEHGQKIHRKAIEEGYSNIQEYCDKYAKIWEEFATRFQIDYNSFYRTTSLAHKEEVKRYLDEIKDYTYRKLYSGQYCTGCEAFKTEKEIHDGKCLIHGEHLTTIEEENLFFKLSSFAPYIKDILVNKNLSKELANQMAEDYDLSITRRNVQWGVELNEHETIYVWFEALLNYCLSIGYYENPEKFKEFWSESLIICGKDNLKFQAYILQAMLLANNVPQTKEVLVHGTILDNKGIKMSKSLGNVIDPVQQVEKYGLSPVKYYLSFGLHIFEDSKYSEDDLITIWNTEIVNGLGNLISRTLHLIDIKDVQLDIQFITNEQITEEHERNIRIGQAFESYNFQLVRRELNALVTKLNIRIQVERPFDKESENYVQVLNEIYHDLESVIPYYCIILKEYKDKLIKAFENNKKTLIFARL
jgi:methionyl-tRNA synthetase